MGKRRIRNIINPEYIRRGNILRYVSRKNDDEDYKGNPLCVVDSLNYDSFGRCTITIHLLLKPDWTAEIPEAYDLLQCVPLCNEIMESLGSFENKTVEADIHEYMYIQKTKAYPNLYIWFDGKTVNEQSSISSEIESEPSLFGAKTVAHVSSLSGFQNLSIFFNMNLCGLYGKIAELEKNNILSRETLYEDY
jgi:hypothetical protein